MTVPPCNHIRVEMPEFGYLFPDDVGQHTITFYVRDF
jgi:hypothetical protein